MKIFYLRFFFELFFFFFAIFEILHFLLSCSSFIKLGNHAEKKINLETGVKIFVTP